MRRGGRGQHGCFIVGLVVSGGEAGGVPRRTGGEGAAIELLRALLCATADYDVHANSKILLDMCGLPPNCGLLAAESPSEGVVYIVADSPLDGVPTAGYDAEELGIENEEIQIAVRAYTGALLICQIAHMFVYVSPSLDSSLFRTLNLLQVAKGVSCSWARGNVSTPGQVKGGALKLLPGRIVPIFTSMVVSESGREVLSSQEGILRSLLRKSRIAINSADGVAVQTPSQANSAPLICVSSHEAIRVIGLNALAKVISTLRQGLIMKKRLPYNVKEWANAVRNSSIAAGSTSSETIEFLQTCLKSENS